jgi:LPXTG-site transpeptidase (sortase) family protein
VATQVPQAPLAPDGNLGTSPWAVPLLIHAKDDQVAQVKEDKPKKDKKSGKSWGLIIVLALMVLLISGGIGAIAGSNVVARAGYESRLASSMTVAVLKIPRLGDDYAVPILEGTSWAELRQGVGWYAKTGRPAEIGNFALAGHRLGWGQPFANLDSLEVGDEIQVVVNGKTFTYLVITGPTVFSNESVDVIAPVPGDPDRLPTKPLITLTTAASMLPSPDRLVVIGELVLD